MLHRLALRVIPQLSAAVTEREVRKRKRLVMLAPGFIAFLLYRLFKDSLPLGDPFVLLAFSGVISTLTALWAYGRGRKEALSRILKSNSLKPYYTPPVAPLVHCHFDPWENSPPFPPRSRSFGPRDFSLHSK